MPLFGGGAGSGDSLMASNIVKKPEEIDRILDPYVLLWDSSVTPGMNNMNKAINLMAKKGWKCISICIEPVGGTTMYALMQKTA